MRGLLLVLASLILCSCDTEPLFLKKTVKSWKNLQNKLEDEIDQIFGEKRPAFSGQYFKYWLDGDYMAFHEGSDKLPSWLHFDPDKNKLHGVPTESDIHENLKIEFRKKNKNFIDGLDKKEVKHLIIDVRPSKEESLFKCSNENASPFIGSIIFYDDINNYVGEDRVKLLRGFAISMKTRVSNLLLEVGNRMNKPSMINQWPETSGPGDKIYQLNDADNPMFTISWKIHCERDLAGTEVVMRLRKLSESEDFSSEFNTKVLGWLVTASKRHRQKRAIGASGSTPSVSGATPTLIQPSPSTVKVTSTVFKPSPTKSSKAMMNTAMPTDPVISRSTITSDKVTTPATPKITPAKNSPPTVLNDVAPISLYVQQALQTSIPSNTFHDPDGDSLVITLLYLPGGGKPLQELPSNFWLEYKNKNLYILPGANTTGKYQFALKATDPSGKYVLAMFAVHVRNDQMFYNTIFNLTLDENFEKYNNSVENKLTLIQKLASATGRDYEAMRSLEFLPGSLIIRWGVAENNLNYCNNPEVHAYLQILESSELRDALAPLVITNTGRTLAVECPVVHPPGHEEDDANIFERILIPVIVIVIILLIIGLILCCVYRRKQKSEPKYENDYVTNHKKPVIFREEYEEKQPDFVSLQPLILPNEKPPIPAAYEPRTVTPDGPGSSISTESDERALLTPSSPKDNSRNGYNAPPPYSAR